ncbi:MAG: hypothetical protein JO235_04945 [Chroococcidiopsidaceae cyanobacterium CP_BM_RX_35]|nr:hypothetical protein [Chroococcidiopsidaceae cyanobacterium CP_BM_RX_35]
MARVPRPFIRRCGVIYLTSIVLTSVVAIPTALPSVAAPLPAFADRRTILLGTAKPNTLEFVTDRSPVTLPELDEAIQASLQANAVTHSEQKWSIPSPLDTKVSTRAFDLKGAIARPDSGNHLTTLTQKTAQTSNTTAPAPPAAAGTQSDLAQQATNPIANLISVPLQNNFNFGVGPTKDTQYVLNIQPVIPVRLSKKLLLVTRTIIPFINQPRVGLDPITEEVESGGSTFGLGDINPQFFFVPQTGNSKVTYGVGPIFLLPTATASVLGTGKFGLGPTGVIIVQSGKLQYGALANQIWSVAGDSSRPAVSSFLLQPIFNYSLPHGWTVGTSPQITANWNAGRGDKFTVPLGISVNKLLTLGTQPTNISLAGYYNVIRPGFGPEWTLRFTFTLLFPTAK